MLVTAALVAASCGGGRGEVRPASGRVVLYTSMPENIVTRLAGVFEGSFPDFEGNTWIQPGADSAGGITLEIVRGRTADIEDRIAAEIAAGGIQADVVWLAEPSPYERYKDMGLLAPYRPAKDEPIPAKFVDPDGYYVAGRVISMVIAWNAERVPDGIYDWPDLQRAVDTAFPSPESGASRATIKALIDRYGRDYFLILRRAGGVSVPSNGDARDGLVSGTFDAVAVLDYMVRLAREGGALIDFAYPSSGTVVIPSPLAITADSRNPEAARVFVDYVLSRTGQQIIVELGSFYPVRTDVLPPHGAPALEEIPAIDVDWKALAGDADLIDALWTSLYGD